jgi:hypothetical protein
MKDRPILFSGPMVRALLDGSKTQTRRVVKMKSHHQIEERDDGTLWPWMHDSERDSDSWMHCPYGQPGDRLWVRENFADLRGTGIEHRPTPSSAIQRYAFAADTKAGSHADDARKNYGIRWKPCIHMPRSASRITLEITGVRVERLQYISDEDSLAEGVYPTATGLYPGSPREAYRKLWESINGPGSWDANPWVWAVEFKRLKGCAT